MSGAVVDRFRGCALALLLLVIAAGPARADELANFHAAIERVSVECRSAIGVLDTSGPEATAAAVGRLRASWQVVVQQFGAHAPPALADRESYTTTLLDMDVRLVGTLIIINAGRREAARQALTGIEETLSRLETLSAAPLP